MKSNFLILSAFLMISCGVNSEKTKTDFLNSIQGTWTVSKIKNITKENHTNHQKTPFIKFDKEKVSGNNGCNNYFSSINGIDAKSIEFSPFGETRMMCRDMKISDTFDLYLSKIKTYFIDKKRLTLFNSEEEKLLVFTKP
ncbi:MAG: META domain-containing protein [Polaribacter sp.]